MSTNRLPPGLSPGHPAAWLSTWFFSGLLPLAPGTWGTLAALPFAWGVATVAGGGGLLVASLVVFAAGIPAAATYIRHADADDPAAVVVDEVAGVWLALTVAAPGWLAYALGFALFRLFDITKPWPVGWLDRNISGGLGVMLDDMAAGAYAGLCLWLIGRYLLNWA